MVLVVSVSIHVQFHPDDAQLTNMLMKLTITYRIKSLYDGTQQSFIDWLPLSLAYEA
jgi:hypothetical protein